MPHLYKTSKNASKYLRNHCGVVLFVLSIIQTCCTKQDPDEAFAYHTPAVVKIKDRKLDLMKMMFTIIAFFYIVIYNVFLDHGWAKTMQPSGVVRLSSLQPKRNNQGLNLL